MAIASNIPAFFIETLTEQYGADDAQRVIDGCRIRRATTLRANALKADREQVAQELDAAGIPWSSVPWYADAFIIGSDRRQDFRGLEAYEQGLIYLQSLSSMLPPLALGARAGEDVLDMCAAPGGKTTQIAALTGGKAHITACEMHAPRAERLEYNLRKLGAANVTVMRTDARRLDDFFAFDRILVDAPCSGSGTIYADDPRMPKRFTQALVQKCRKQQKALLDKALHLLKPGGTIVYSTCSVLACENENIVQAALAQAKRGRFEIAPIEIDGFGDVPLLPTSLEGTVTVCPTDTYEGFFLVKIARTDA